MATHDALVRAIEMIEAAWPKEKATVAWGDDAWDETQRAHIADSDVISAAKWLRLQKTGRAPFPSVEQFLTAVEAQRSERLRRDAQSGQGGVSDLLNAPDEGVVYAIRLYGRALLLMLKGRCGDPAEAVSRAAEALLAEGYTDDGGKLTLSKSAMPTSLQLAVNARQRKDAALV